MSRARTFRSVAAAHTLLTAASVTSLDSRTTHVNRRTGTHEALRCLRYDPTSSRTRWSVFDRMTRVIRATMCLQPHFKMQHTYKKPTHAYHIMIIQAVERSYASGSNTRKTLMLRSSREPFIYLHAQTTRETQRHSNCFCRF